MQRSLLFQAIYTKFSGSDLSNDVGGRMYSEFPPDDAQFPYVIFKLISVMPIDSFKDYIDDINAQFSLYSTSDSLTEITTMENHLLSLYDDTTLTIANDTVVMCVRTGTTPLYPEPMVGEGVETTFLRHWAVEYRIVVND